MVSIDTSLKLIGWMLIYGIMFVCFFIYFSMENKRNLANHLNETQWFICFFWPLVIFVHLIVFAIKVFFVGGFGFVTSITDKFYD